MQFTIFDTEVVKDFKRSSIPKPHPPLQSHTGFLTDMLSFCLVLWFSNLGATEAHEGLLKHRVLGTTLRVSNSIGMGLPFLTSSLDAHVICQGTTL